MAQLERFENAYDISSALMSVSDLSDLHGFAYGIASYLRGYITWPKIKSKYQDFKKFFGRKSLMIHDIKMSEFKGLSRREEQWIAYYMLHMLFEQRYQDPEYLSQALQFCSHRFELCNALTMGVLSDIWNDSVNDKIERVEVPVTLFPEIRKMVKAIKKEEKYSELPILADAIEDAHYYEPWARDFCEHFRSGCIHTYGCKFLRVMPEK